MVSLLSFGIVVVVLVILGVGYFSYSGNFILGESKQIEDIELSTIELPVLEPSPTPTVENVDKCKNIMCERSSLECPDGFVASCANICLNNSCGECVPSCTGHEKMTEKKDAISESLLPSYSPPPSPTGTLVSDITTPTPEPTQTQEIKQPKITNIKFDADGDDRKKENWNTEWVEIDGQGVDMSGWTLQDNSTHKFVFPDGFIIGSLIKVKSGYGTNTQTELYFGDGPVWNNDGDVAYLKDKDGNTIDQYSYG